MNEADQHNWHEEYDANGELYWCCGLCGLVDDMRGDCEIPKTCPGHEEIICGGKHAGEPKS